MKTSFKISLARLVVIQLIPIIGLIFFEWQLFDLTVVYLLESVAVFFVFNFHQYFIQKSTRYPFGFALIQLLFSLIFFSGLMFGFLVVLYVVTGEAKFGHFQDHMYHRLMLMNFWWVLLMLMILEFTSFYLKISRSKILVVLNFASAMKRILFTYLFVIGSLVLLLLTLGNHIILYTLLVIMKMIFEIAMEDPKIIEYFRVKLGFGKRKSN